VFGGDDIVVRARGDLIDPAEPGEAMEFLAGLGVDAVGLRALGGPAGVAKLKAEGARADCEVGADLTARLGLPEAVVCGATPGSPDADALSLLASWHATGNAENTTLRQT